MTANEKLELLSNFYQSSIYIAGCAFIAGSAITLLILLMLDFIRRNDGKTEDETPTE